MIEHEDEDFFVIPDFAKGTATVPKVKPDVPCQQARLHPAFDPSIEGMRLTDAKQVVKHLAATVAREIYVRDFGFAMLTSESLDALASLLAGIRTLEVGAGSGYLSAALAKRGVMVTASDLGDEKAASFGISRVWRRDHEGDSLTLIPGDYGAILMSWPSGKFAWNVAMKMAAGQMLVYQGEGFRGRTADNDFFELIAEPGRFIELRGSGDRLNEHHLQFSGMRDSWHVYRKC